MADPLDDLLAEHADLEARLADPSVHADPATARGLGRRYAVVGPTGAAAHERDALRGDLAAARELEMDDEEGSEPLPLIGSEEPAVEPAAYAALAANEAEKASAINVLEVRAFGSMGRVYLGGEERDIDVGWRAAVDALEGLSGRDAG